jgi:hypothetical protein
MPAVAGGDRGPEYASGFNPAHRVVDRRGQRRFALFAIHVERVEGEPRRQANVRARPPAPPRPELSSIGGGVEKAVLGQRHLPSGADRQHGPASRRVGEGRLQQLALRRTPSASPGGHWSALPTVGVTRWLGVIQRGTVVERRKLQVRRDHLLDDQRPSASTVS